MSKRKKNIWKKQIGSDSNLSSSFEPDDYEAD